MEQFDQIQTSSLPILVEFYADWCSSCQTMRPIIERIEKQFQYQLEVIKINSDDHPQVASTFGVQSLPTFLLFHHGELLWKQAGTIPFSVVKKQLEKYLELSNQLHYQQNNPKKSEGSKKK